MHVIPQIAGDRAALSHLKVLYYPCTKKSPISCMNDLRPVALTAVPMKILERVFLNKFKSCVSPFLDPMQFAYQSGRSCEDALLTLLDKMYSHLERARFGNSVRLLFLDFSSACL